MGMFDAKSLKDKVRKARNKATSLETGIAASETVERNARAGKTRLSMAEERAAVKVLEPRMRQDRKKTAARAVGIEKREVKKAAAKRAATAIGNPPAKKRAIKPTAKTAKFNAAAKAKEAAKKKK
jgi:hypothetical protein